jgi:hypothetical protein
MAAVVSIENDPSLINKDKSRLKCQRKFGFADTLCGCVCCGICITIVLTVIITAITLLSMFYNTYPIDKFANVNYKAADGTTLHAYLASPTPEAAASAALRSNSSAPIVSIVFHAWNGLGDEAVYFADRLAEEGYYAIAPDLFRGVASAPTNIVRNIYNVVTAPQARMDDDVDAALAFIKEKYATSSKDVISGPGFCFGGAQSLIFSARYEVRLELDTRFSKYVFIKLLVSVAIC